MAAGGPRDLPAQNGLTTPWTTPATAARRTFGAATGTITSVFFLEMLHTEYHLPTKGALSTVESNDHIMGDVATLLRPLVIRCVGAVATAGPLVTLVV